MVKWDVRNYVVPFEMFEMIDCMASVNVDRRKKRILIVVIV